MPKTSKVGKRSRDDLELFILALLKHGIRSSYDLLVRGGLSPGASLPALDRLENAGFVERGRALARGRVEYSLTSMGARHLERGWKPLLESASDDFEVVVRIAALALLMGEKTTIVARFLKGVARRKAKIPSGGNLPRGGAREPVFFSQARQIATPGKIAAEVAAFRKIAAFLIKG